jgi:hypothetical protein
MGLAWVEAIVDNYSLCCYWEHVEEHCEEPIGNLRDFFGT